MDKNQENKAGILQIANENFNTLHMNHATRKYQSGLNNIYLSFKKNNNNTGTTEVWTTGSHIL